MKKKSYSILLLLTTCALALAPMVSAVTVTITWWAGSDNNWLRLEAVHPAAGSAVSAVSQSFNASQTGYVTLLSLSMKKVGTPNGTLIATINGVAADGENPNATVFTTSNSFAISDISTLSYAFYDFVFPGDYAVTQYLNYTLIIYVSEASTISTSSYVIVNANYNVNYPDCAEYFASAWSITDGGRFNLYLYGSDTPLTLPSASPTSPTWTPFYGSGGDDSYGTAVNFLIPVAIMLLPALLLWWLGGRGKWPILIGLAIGTGLGYFFGYVPIWLVFLVAIGLIGMAYSDVSSGGSYT